VLASMSGVGIDVGVCVGIVDEVGACCDVGVGVGAGVWVVLSMIKLPAEALFRLL